MEKLIFLAMGHDADLYETEPVWDGAGFSNPSGLESEWVESPPAWLTKGQVWECLPRTAKAYVTDMSWDRRLWRLVKDYTLLIPGMPNAPLPWIHESGLYLDYICDASGRMVADNLQPVEAAWIVESVNNSVQVEFKKDSVQELVERTSALIGHIDRYSGGFSGGMVLRAEDIKELRVLLAEVKGGNNVSV